MRRATQLLPERLFGTLKGVATAPLLAIGLTGLLAQAPGSAFAEEGAEPPSPIFADRAADFGIDFVHFNGMSGEYYFVEMMGSGGALLDYDGDGDLDAYLVQGHMLPEDAGPPDPRQTTRGRPIGDRLFRHDLVTDSEGHTSPRFVDVTPSSGIQATGYGMGVAAADYDGDGHTDLYVTNFGSNQLLRNRGDGTFEDVTEAAGADDPRWSVPATFLDYDRDGFLDLWLGNYVNYTVSIDRHCASETGRRQYCGPLAYRPDGDRLLHNRGDGTFEDTTVASGLAAEFGNALGGVASDFDGDGWMDLYIGNDQVPNQLWINQRDGTFRNDALLAGCAVNWEGQPEASMGVHAADIDGDGDEDLILTHLRGETNTLYLNDGRGMFTDQTTASGLGPASWSFTSFGTAWLDFDNDGRLDLLSVNGAVRILDDLATAGDPYPLHQTNQLFHNQGGTFVEVTESAGAVFTLSEVSRGAVFGDIDNDGDVDVLISNNSGPARLLMNQVGHRTPWLSLRLTRPGPGATDLVGARARLTRSDGEALWRRVRTEGSYASANDPRLHFGLGPGDGAGSAEIYWADGTRSHFEALPTGAFIRILGR